MYGVDVLSAYVLRLRCGRCVRFVCRPCSRCSGPVDRSVGYPTTGLWVCDAAGGAGACAPYCVVGAGVECRGCVGVVQALLRVLWLNVRSSALLHLYLRFCILDVVLVYF